VKQVTEVEFPCKIADKKRKPSLKAKATIMKVQLLKAVEIFKDKAKDPEQQLYAVQGLVNDHEMRIAAFAMPQSIEISPKSKLARFKLRHKQFPKLGMKVDVVTDDKGYWKIALRLPVPISPLFRLRIAFFQAISLVRRLKFTSAHFDSVYLNSYLCR
jgi:hypothetical protein